ncbi:MAG: phage major capsid protein [Candidatus Korobacteraceae bacterium]
MEKTELSRDAIKGLIAEILGPEVDDIRQAVAQRDNLQTRAMLGGQGTTQEPKDTTESVGGFIKALVMARGDPDRAYRFAKSTFGDESKITKALSASVDVTGGFLIPEVLSTEIIEFLRPASVVRAMGARVMPLVNYQMSIPKVTAGANATYVGENVNIQATQQEFGQLTLVAKKLAALVPISNELLQVNTIAADQIVRQDLVKAMAQREDLAFIRGDGTQNTPKGILNWVNSNNIFPATTVTSGMTTLQNATNDLATCILKLREANIPMTNCGWIIAPQIEYFLSTLRDSLGNYAFRPEMSTGKLLGFPYSVTTQIPVNLTTGEVTNCSEIYFVNFDDCFIGDTMQVRIDVSNTAAYYDGQQVVATFSEDQTIIRAISMHDFIMRYDYAGAVMNEVAGWGVNVA